MSFNSQILFFLGALGVFNGLIISIYFLFFKKPKFIKNTFFGLFLFMLCARVIKSIFYYFDTNIVEGYLNVGPISFIFIGPFLLFYSLSFCKRESLILKNWKHQALVWLIIIIALHYFYPFKEDPCLWKDYIIDFINIQWLLYILLSGFVIIINIKKNKRVFKYHLWLLYLILSNLGIWFIYFFIEYDFFIAGSISFSILFYLALLFFLLDKKNQQIFNKKKIYDVRTEELSSSEKFLVYELKRIFDEKKLYKNQNLKSSDIANSLNISNHKLSQLLNNYIGKSFSTFVNEYRIEKAKELIRSNNKYTLEAIGSDSGFKSKSAFYRCFKQLAGMTPSEYRK